MRAFALVAALLALAQPAAAYFDPFICVVNAARAAHGVGPVGWSRDLQGVARWVASDMERTGLVSHFGS